ncbi:MAG: general secretion pathway protein GspE, partial [Planctomycetota bacterium]
MDPEFDPYRRWLGIPPDEQPPNHYRLLGIGLFESDVDVINNAAERQMTHLRRFQTGVHAAECQRLLNEVAAARICLT